MHMQQLLPFECLASRLGNILLMQLFCIELGIFIFFFLFVFNISNVCHSTMSFYSPSTVFTHSEQDLGWETACQEESSEEDVGRSAPCCSALGSACSASWYQCHHMWPQGGHLSVQESSEDIRLKQQLLHHSHLTLIMPSGSSRAPLNLTDPWSLS